MWLVKKLPLGWRQRLRQKSGGQGVQSCLRASLSEGPQPALSQAGLRSLVRWLSLMNFSSSSRKCFSRKSQGWESLWVNPGHADSAGPGSGFLPGPRPPRWHPGCDPTRPEAASARPGRGLSCSLGFAYSGDVWHPCIFPLAHGWPYFCSGNRSLERETGMGSP